MITVYKITLVGYVIEEEFGEKDRIAPVDWPLEAIVQDMVGVARTQEVIDTIKEKNDG